ncbi:MAG: NAD-binding protein [Kiritimatiellae bacterium]|nr:NAD-binding protein [Kiritimatiellia bacterium]
MKIFIIGAGFTGTQLARALVLERNNVILIDNDPERVRYASDQLDCTVLEADGNNLESLEEAGIASADALVTLTEDDEINMITCSLVDAVYPRIQKIARVRNYAYYTAADVARRRTKSAMPASRPLYGIDSMLNPEVEAADAISVALEHGAIGSVIELDADFGITTLSIGEGSPLVGLPFSELPKLDGWHYLVAFVESGDGTTSLPNGQTSLAVGDQIGIVSRLSEISQLVAYTKTPQEKLRRVVVFGADRVGSLLLARQQEKLHVARWKRLFGISAPNSYQKVLVVDRDPDLCRETVERFPDVRVLCGDVTDEALLTEEDIFSCDLLVAASGNYELNLVTAAYLKSRGVKKTIALTANSSYGDIARKLGVDVAVPMRGTVVDSILGHLRGRRVESVHSVCNRRFEIVEGYISPKSPVVGKRLQDIIDLGAYLVLLYCPVTGTSYEMPRGSTVLKADAHVVLITPAGDTRLVARFCGKE